MKPPPSDPVLATVVSVPSIRLRGMSRDPTPATDETSTAFEVDVDVDERTPRRVDLQLALTIVVGVGLGLKFADAVGTVISRLQGLLVTLVISLFLSFAMEPAVQWASKRNMRRGFATGLLFLLIFVVLSGFIAAMVPLIASQVTNLVDNGPQLAQNLADQATKLPGDLGESVSTFIENQKATLPDKIPGFAGQIGSTALGLGTSILGGLIQALTVLLVTFYLVADGPKLRRALSSRLPPRRQEEFLDIWELAISKTGGYVYSRVLTAVTSAIFHVVVFTVIGLEYPLALGIFVGLVSSLIPVVGTYIAGALPLVVAIAERPLLALWVVLAIAAYQQLENYVVAPRITAATMELHPAIAFVAVLGGAALLGAVGALLALPAAAIVAALVSAYGERYEVHHEVDHRFTRSPSPSGGPGRAAKPERDRPKDPYADPLPR